MTGLKQNTVVKTILVFCIVMQTALFMPHHHHDGSSAPCINPIHCISAGHSEDHSCSGTDNVASQHDSHLACGDEHHDHNGCAGHSHDKCNFSHIDITPPARDLDLNLAQLALTAFEPLYCGLGCCDDLLGVAYRNVLAALDLETHIGALPLHTIYIATATPSRAPSFTV